MTASGEMTNPTVKANTSMQMETFTNLNKQMMVTTLKANRNKLQNETNSNAHQNNNNKDIYYCYY
jgi:hypothetical protein